MNGWIDKEKVIKTLKNKDASLLKAWGGSYCLSSDYKTCLFVQEHSAWIVENQGWRYSNTQPEKNEQTRAMLNIIHLNNDNNSIWFKMFVPLKSGALELTTMKQYYVIKSQTESLKGNFDSIKTLMFKVMTGNAQTEIDIESKFVLLNQKQ